MTAQESPAVARRRLRLALRRAREATGLTQTQVAEALEWSLSKVNRIESGDVTISGTDLRALLSLLGVTDPDVVAELIEDGRAARRRGWWDEPRYREHQTPATMQLLQFEGEASAIRCFQPALFPGLLQTRAYAHQILKIWAEELSEEDRDSRLEVRLHRRGQVFEKSDPPDYLLVLDESALLREVGGAEVLAEQLNDTLAVMAHPNVMIRILPLARATMAMIGAFTLLDLGEEENAILYRESLLQDEIVHSSEQIRRYRTAFEQMWRESLPQAQTRQLLKSRAAALTRTDA